MSESTIADQLSQSFATLVEQTGASVVRVEARRRGGATGVAWAPDLVVTSHHAVEIEEGIEVGLPDGRSVAATLLGRDPATDLAVLKVEGAGLTAARFDDAADLRVGQFTLALSRPGRTVRATLGIVSALGTEPFRTPGGGRVERYVEIDNDLPRGWSGGPVVDARGRVLGIASTGIMRGAGLVIPTATVRRVVEAVQKQGSLQRGYLGIGSFPVRLPGRLAQVAGQDGGLLVNGVQEGSPADAAGVLLGDVLVLLAGKPVRSIGDLFEILDEDRVGKATPARVIRAGALVDLAITPSARG